MMDFSSHNHRGQRHQTRQTRQTNLSPFLLSIAFLFVTSSPAWARAFSNAGVSSLRPPPCGSFARTRTARTTRTGSQWFTPSMKSTSSSPSSSPKLLSNLSYSTLLFLRGGQQQVQLDETDTLTTVVTIDTADTANTADTATEETEVTMQRHYGTKSSSISVGEESVGTSSMGGSVEMAGYGEASSQMDQMDIETPENSRPLTQEKTRPLSPLSPLLSSMSTPLVGISGILQTAASHYTLLLAKRPILTKSLTAGIIFALSDYCAQIIERDNLSESSPSTHTSSSTSSSLSSSIIFSRILTAFLVGTLFFGPAAHAWYSAIFRLLPSTSLVSTLQKAALGQIIFGPVFTCVFFGAGLIQAGGFGNGNDNSSINGGNGVAGFTLGNWFRKIQTDLPAVWASGLGFWPLVDFISYKVVPVQWIPLFVNFCSFVWTIYLSLVSNRDG